MTAFGPDPHATQPVLRAGVSLDEATGLVILLHGRGSPAANIIQLASHLAPSGDEPQQIAFAAPQANGNTWYPLPFLAPIEQNEPFLSSALRRIDALIDEAIDAGLHPRQVALIGFSQGACLALEYTAQGRRAVAAVAGLAGALIGDPAAPRAPMADLRGVSAFVGVGAEDTFVDPALVKWAADQLRNAGAAVDFREYPSTGHVILGDEIAAARNLVLGLPLIGPIANQPPMGSDSI